MSDRQTLQAAGTHPAPCARHCEAKAYEIEIRGLKSALRAALEQQAEPVALIRDGVLCWHIPNPQHARPAWTAHGTHMLYTRPPQRKPLTINEVEKILAQHDYAVHGDRARYIVRMTEEAHDIKETP